MNLNKICFNVDCFDVLIANQNQHEDNMTSFAHLAGSRHRCYWFYLISIPGGDSLLVRIILRGGQTFFGFVKRCLVYLWVRYLVHNRYIFGVADEKT